jgi:imidazole glycerol-phosphate synthase subunit HisH
MSSNQVRLAIVDYGLGNLYSVKQACEYAGMETEITSSKDALFAADAVILPGVGAFGDAMATLGKLDLAQVLRDIAESGKFLIGICLGMQLLMTESYEFGAHKGLGIIDGVVIPFEDPVHAVSFDDSLRKLKVPQVGWNKIWQPSPSNPQVPHLWQSEFLDDVPNGEYMYFVHSLYVKPADENVIVSLSNYGQIEFCSSLQYNNVFACQFHPERSATQGLNIYEKIASMVKRSGDK